MAGSETSSPQAHPPTEAPGFAAELAKLEELRAALWQAFKAGPEAGLPTMLIELTNCYTNTLRFQLNMKALNSQKPASAHASATRAKTQK